MTHGSTTRIVDGVTVERRLSSGMLIVSDIVNGYRVARKYLGYSQAEAVAMFKQEVQP